MYLLFSKKKIYCHETKNAFDSGNKIYWNLFTWSNFNNSSGVSGSCPSVKGGLILTSLPRERTTSSRLYRSANTQLAGINPWTV